MDSALTPLRRARLYLFFDVEKGSALLVHAEIGADDGSGALPAYLGWYTVATMDSVPYPTVTADRFTQAMAQLYTDLCGGSGGRMPWLKDMLSCTCVGL